MNHSYLYQMEPVFDNDEVTAVVECVRSSWVIEASRTDAFERKIAAYVGSKYAVCVPSCTVAMALSLMALGVGYGDEVIVPALTFVATANAVSLTGAKPVIVDIHPDSHGLDYRRLDQAITTRTKAILPVWMNGCDPDIRRIVQVANAYNLPVVEDAACALGSRTESKHAGSFGQAGCISFNTTKIITTGMGGVIVTNDDDLYDKVERLKNHGRRDRQDFHPVVGFNFGFSDLLAALGLAQMDKLAQRVAWKQQLCKWYCDRLEGVAGIEVRRPKDGICPWYPDIFVENRSDLKAYLESQGIQTRLYYPSISTQPSYQCSASMEVASTVAARGLWLPSAAYVDKIIVDRVCDEICQWLSKMRTTDTIM